MKSLKRILTESRQSSLNRQQDKSAKRSKKEEIEFAKGSAFAFDYSYDGIDFKPSIHAMSRARERRPEFNKGKWKDMHQKIAEFLNIGKKNKDGGYMFYVKSLKQGYIAQVTKHNKLVRIITVYPRKKSQLGAGDNKKRVVLEFLETIEENWEELGIDIENIIEVEI